MRILAQFTPKCLKLNISFYCMHEFLSKDLHLFFMKKHFETNTKVNDLDPVSCKLINLYLIRKPDSPHPGSQ